MTLATSIWPSCRKASVHAVQETCYLLSISFLVVTIFPMQNDKAASYSGLTLVYSLSVLLSEVGIKSRGRHVTISLGILQLWPYHRESSSLDTPILVPLTYPWVPCVFSVSSLPRPPTRPSNTVLMVKGCSIYQQKPHPTTAQNDLLPNRQSFSFCVFSALYPVTIPSLKFFSLLDLE